MKSSGCKSIFLPYNRFAVAYVSFYTWSILDVSAISDDHLCVLNSYPKDDGEIGSLINRLVTEIRRRLLRMARLKDAGR